MGKSCHQNQDRAKSWKKQFSNSFLIEFWIEKSRHQNQDRAKSWKNQIPNTFLIEFWIEKSRRQNQDRAKKWKKHFFNTFLNWNLKKTWFWKWNLCRGTIKMLNTHQIVYIYIYIYIYETVQLEPPPTISVFSKINELCIKIQYTNIRAQIVYIYIYVYEIVQLEPPPPSAFFLK